MTNQDYISLFRETLRTWLENDSLTVADVETIIMNFTGKLEEMGEEKVLFAARLSIEGDNLSANDEDDIMAEFERNIGRKLHLSGAIHEEQKTITFEIIDLLMTNYHKLSQKSLEAVLNELKSRVS